MGFDAAPPPVFVITGAQAAGKSSVAEALAARFPRSVHVRGDIFRRMVTRGREDMTADPGPGAVAQLELRHRLTALTADEYHRAGFAVVVQDVIIGPHLAAMVTALRARPLYVVVLVPRPDVLADREASRDKTAYNGGFTPSILDAALRRDTSPIGLWLDSSDLGIEATVDAILDRREEARVDTARL